VIKVNWVCKQGDHGRFCVLLMDQILFEHFYMRLNSFFDD